MAIKLFDFQSQAASTMVEAIEEWIQAYAEEGPRYIGRTTVPFIGHLKAVTGAGKTPILAKVVGDLVNGVVLWTSKASAVADQTYRNLTGKYAHLLPAGTTVVRERPSKSDWEAIMESDRGITIWVSTVGSWNEADAAETSGDESARLNMHRPQKDWGGPSSPWDQLRRNLKRPLWVVYDESHNQTPTQLDQLTGLGPLGFLLASATPPEGGQFDKYASVVDDDEQLKPIAAKGRVRVSTADVVAHQLLKHTIQVENFDSDADTLLDAALDLHRQLTEAAEAEGVAVRPKTLYVVEKSNPSKGEITSRPLAIWDHLRDRGVQADEIAVYTQTKVLPEDAVRITSLSELKDHHTHIICNRALQEGWDDPEAYVEYFDDESNSYVRIAQVIGRALRQPDSRHFADDRLNTATLFVRVPNRQFDHIVEGLKKELSLYATDENDPYGSPAVRIRTRKDPLDPIPVKVDLSWNLSLPQYQLGEADLKAEVAKVEALSRQPFDTQDLLAAGGRSIRRISLRGEAEVKDYEAIAASMRRKNGEYLRRRIQIRSRHCAHLLEPDIFSGPAYEQWSCSASTAQAILSERANAMVQAFESTVELVPVKIHGEETWEPGPHQPGSSNLEVFSNAIHPHYSRSGFNNDELDFAKALDGLNVGYWMRNPSRGDGYGVALPMKVGDSSTFYPDFLWWVNGECFAIDPTGAHILEGKVRGKLLNIDTPKIVLITKGRVAPDWLSTEESDDYTVVRPRKNQSARPEYFTNLRDALRRIGGMG
jgi:type III restriction enzyme